MTGDLQIFRYGFSDFEAAMSRAYARPSRASRPLMAGGTGRASASDRASHGGAGGGHGGERSDVGGGGGAAATTAARRPTEGGGGTVVEGRGMVDALMRIAAGRARDWHLLQSVRAGALDVPPDALQRLAAEARWCAQLKSALALVS